MAPKNALGPSPFTPLVSGVVSSMVQVSEHEVRKPVSLRSLHAEKEGEELFCWDKEGDTHMRKYADPVWKIRIYNSQAIQTQAYPPRSIYDFIIQKLKPFIIIIRKLNSSRGFQIHLCILLRVMSSELTLELVMNFPRVQFPRIWCKCLRSNFIHSRIFSLTK